MIFSCQPDTVSFPRCQRIGIPFHSSLVAITMSLLSRPKRVWLQTDQLNTKLWLLVRTYICGSLTFIKSRRLDLFYSMHRCMHSGNEQYMKPFSMDSFSSGKAARSLAIVQLITPFANVSSSRRSQMYNKKGHPALVRWDCQSGLPKVICRLLKRPTPSYPFTNSPQTMYLPSKCWCHPRMFSLQMAIRDEFSFMQRQA